MNYRRFATVCAASLMWAVLDIINGRPGTAETWLLAGFVMAWCTES